MCYIFFTLLSRTSPSIFFKNILEYIFSISDFSSCFRKTIEKLNLIWPVSTKQRQRVRSVQTIIIRLFGEWLGSREATDRIRYHSKPNTNVTTRHSNVVPEANNARAVVIIKRSLIEFRVDLIKCKSLWHPTPRAHLQVRLGRGLRMTIINIYDVTSRVGPGRRFGKNIRIAPRTTGIIRMSRDRKWEQLGTHREFVASRLVFDNIVTWQDLQR